MRTVWMSAAVLGLSLLAGCKQRGDKDAIREVDVKQAASLQQQTPAPVFVDANTVEFRKANGIVPGAVLLDDYNEYDPKAVLPADQGTPLVFYCSNQH